jgi:multisubunit Na+/H+ antiporter MnhF subunit
VNEFLVAAIALVVTLFPCVAVCVSADLLEGVVALEVAGVIATLVLLLLAAAFERQPFADVALTASLLSFIGSLAFVRFLERRL